MVSNLTRYVMLVDITRCNGCFTCFLACKDEYWDNDYPSYSKGTPRFGINFLNVLKRERGEYPMADVNYLPYLCQHCGDAPCIDAAEDGAVYRRDDGIVIIDPEKAKGQDQIVESCPYDVISWNEELELPQKCTFCAHLLDEEDWDKPRCVQACPTKALRFGDADDPDSEVSELLDTGEFEPLDEEREPCVYYKGLDSYEKDFVSGSVVIEGEEECLEGADVSLYSGGECIDTSVTNAFGDFMIDGLETGNEYEVVVESSGYEEFSESLVLEDSTHLGDIFLKKK